MVLAGRVQTEIRGIKSESFKAGSRVKKLFLTKTVPLVNPLVWDHPVLVTATTHYAAGRYSFQFLGCFVSFCSRILTNSGRFFCN